MKKNNIVLIGAGIMSATLGVFLKRLMPDSTIHIYERMDKVAAESSAAWNNAGTGHSAFCELNYTPEFEDGSIDISKAIRIGSSFEVSKQFWAYLVENQLIETAFPFINDVPHMSFVWGKENIDFLRKRYNALIKYPLFDEMKYSEEMAQIKEWLPLMMEGRTDDEPIAVTRMDIGTDVNFGALTRGMIRYLETCDGVELHLGHEIQELTQIQDGWIIDVENLETEDEFQVHAQFVFIGAGGGALPLLEKTDIPEADGYGGFPISGQWLKCENPEVVKRHEAKVYGKASEGSPPMSVPHLDKRQMGGKEALLFGPFAGFSTKFLKNGSYFDLPFSIDAHNIWPMLAAGYRNLDLTKYLIEQVTQSPEERFEALQKYYPTAKFEDWELAIAGQRVQIIKKDKEKGGALKFGTEIVTDKKGSMAALLGASPGASTSVAIMLDVLKKCYPEEMKSEEWKDTLKKMIPTYGQTIHDNPALCKATRARTTRILKLEPES